MNGVEGFLTNSKWVIGVKVEGTEFQIRNPLSEKVATRFGPT